MNLTDKIKTVHKFDNDKIIVEFDNGFGVAYEKSEDRVEREVIDADGRVTGIEYKTVPSIRYVELDLRLTQILRQKDLYRGWLTNRATSMEQISRTPRTDAQKQMLELEKTIHKTYDAIVEPLQMEQYKYRPWEQILISAGSYLILSPRSLPNVLSHHIRELISPTNRATRINNKKALSRECEKKNAYLYFPYNEKATPSKFRTFEIVLPDNVRILSATCCTICECAEEKKRQGIRVDERRHLDITARKEKFKIPYLYENNKWYFNADKQACAEISNAVDARDKIQFAYYEFFKDITREDQIQMLKNIYFL